MEKKLYRDELHKKLGGVCAGLAEYFTIDVAIVRLIFVLTCIFHGGGGLVYIILWIVLPKRPYSYFNPMVDYTVPPQNPDAQATSTAGGNTFGSNPFPPNQPNQFGNAPFPPPAPQQHSNTSAVAIVFGIVLVTVGGWILLYNLDLLPDWDFWKIWPVVLIVIGCAIMISGEKKKPVPVADRDKKPDDKDEKTDPSNTTEANPPADTPPAV